MLGTCSSNKSPFSPPIMCRCCLALQMSSPPRLSSTVSVHSTIKFVYQGLHNDNEVLFHSPELVQTHCQFGTGPTGALCWALRAPKHRPSRMVKETHRNCRKFQRYLKDFYSSQNRKTSTVRSFPTKVLVYFGHCDLRYVVLGPTPSLCSSLSNKILAPGSPKN